MRIFSLAQRHYTGWPQNKPLPNYEKLY